MYVCVCVLMYKNVHLDTFNRKFILNLIFCSVYSMCLIYFCGFMFCGAYLYNVVVYMVIPNILLHEADVSFLFLFLLYTFKIKIKLYLHRPCR